ncbi:hypothetical protein [Pseudoalteromonas prydzensis]|uniref:hypothetical protein n=1 Tax=Pseudoalteromonas prydzensis TaxID=182141 RepID=UPI003FD4757C
MGEKYQSPIPTNAVGFQAVRYQRNGNDRLYDTVIFSTENPAVTLDVIYRQMKVFGCIASEAQNSDGMLDYIDSEGDVVHHIPLTKKGLSWVYKKYDLRLVKH